MDWRIRRSLISLILEESITHFGFSQLLIANWYAILFHRVYNCISSLFSGTCNLGFRIRLDAVLVNI